MGISTQNALKQSYLTCCTGLQQTMTPMFLNVALLLIDSQRGVAPDELFDSHVFSCLLLECTLNRSDQWMLFERVKQNGQSVLRRLKGKKIVGWLAWGNNRKFCKKNNLMHTICCRVSINFEAKKYENKTIFVRKRKALENSENRF